MLSFIQEETSDSTEEESKNYTPTWLAKAKNDAHLLEKGWAASFDSELQEKYYQSLYWARFKRS